MTSAHRHMIHVLKQLLLGGDDITVVWLMMEAKLQVQTVDRRQLHTHKHTYTYRQTHTDTHRDTHTQVHTCRHCVRHTHSSVCP